MTLATAFFVHIYIYRQLFNFHNEQQQQKMYLHTCASSEDLDQPAHLHSLIKVFTGHNLDSQGCKVSS